MTDHADWAAELIARADDLRSLTPADLGADLDLEDRFCRAINRFEIPDVIYRTIEDRVVYPPDWEHLDAAVEVDNPYVLWANMSAWVSQGRWFDGPLALVHDKGWLEPAFRRLAASVGVLETEPGMYEEDQTP